jgi:hypothetical protein
MFKCPAAAQNSDPDAKIVSFYELVLIFFFGCKVFDENWNTWKIVYKVFVYLNTYKKIFSLIIYRVMLISLFFVIRFCFFYS